MFPGFGCNVSAYMLSTGFGRISGNSHKDYRTQILAIMPLGSTPKAACDELSWKSAKPKYTENSGKPSHVQVLPCHGMMRRGVMQPHSSWSRHREPNMAQLRYRV